MNINIAGLSKAHVLQALFNASRQQGMGFLDRSGARPMTLEDAASYTDDGRLYFDYLRGRVLKVDISGDGFAPHAYDRDNGAGAAARAIAQLRGAA